MKAVCRRQDKKLPISAKSPSGKKQQKSFPFWFFFLKIKRIQQFHISRLSFKSEDIPSRNNSYIQVTQQNLPIFAKSPPKNGSPFLDFSENRTHSKLSFKFASNPTRDVDMLSRLQHIDDGRTDEWVKNIICSTTS